MARLKILSSAIVPWAPQIVLADLGVAIIAFWSGLVPAVMIYFLGGATLALTLPIYGHWLLDVGLKSNAELGFRRNRDFLAYHLLQRGRREHALGLYFACSMAALLSGFRTPEIILVLAACCLSAGWSMATRRWPRDQANHEAHELKE